jgi:hypothetical protein
MVSRLVDYDQQHQHKDGYHPESHGTPARFPRRLHTNRQKFSKPAHFRLPRKTLVRNRTVRAVEVMPAAAPARRSHTASLE